MVDVLKIKIIEKNKSYDLEIISFKHLGNTLQAVKEKYGLNKVNLIFKDGVYCVYV